MTDIIALIDEVTTPHCGWCRNPLAEDGPSRDFCGEVCQGQWTLRCAAPDAEVDNEAFTLATGGLAPVPAVGALPRFPRATGAAASNLSATLRRLSGVVPPTAVLIGGQRHGTTIAVTDQPALQRAHRHPHPAGWEFRGTANDCHVIYVAANPDLVLYVRPIHRSESVGVELVDADGRSYIQHVTAAQQQPWRHDRFPVGTRFTLPNRFGVWTITAHAEQSFEEFTQDREPQFDYTLWDEQGMKVYVTHEFLTDAVGVRRLPDSAA